MVPGDTIILTLLTIVVTILAWSVKEVVDLGKIVSGLKERVNAHSVVIDKIEKLVEDIAFIRGRLEGRD